jgi:hypothetical protein
MTLQNEVSEALLAIISLISYVYPKSIERNVIKLEF